MSDVYDQVYLHLNGDAILVGTQASPPMGPFSGLLTGGLWKRPLKRATDNVTQSAGSTPAAFGMDGPEAGRIRYAASLVELPEREHPQDDAIPTAVVREFAIHLYAPAHDAGKAAIRAAEERIFDLLYNHRFATDNGPYARVFYESTNGISDSEEFIGAVTDYCRYRVIYRKREALE